MNYLEEKIISRQRIKSLRNCDCLTYYQTCDKLGIEPEDQMLYEHGQAEQNYLKRQNE